MWTLVYLLNKHLLNIWCVPGTVVGSGDKVGWGGEENGGEKA